MKSFWTILLGVVTAGAVVGSWVYAVWILHVGLRWALHLTRS